MKRRQISWVAFAALGAAACVCTSALPIGGQGPAIEAPSAGSPSITVANQSESTICYLYLSPDSRAEWGDDRLESEVLTAGGSLTFDVSAGTYDIKAEDCNNRLIHATAGLSVQGPVTWTVTFSGGSPVPVTLINNSGGEVCYVVISPSTADDWGTVWLGADETLPSGSSRVFDVPGGNYDMQARDCGEDVIGELSNVALDAAYSWDLR